MTSLINFKNHPILIYDSHLGHACRSGEASQKIIDNLEKNGMFIILASSAKDVYNYLAYSPEICAVVFDWDSLNNEKIDVDNFVQKIFAFNMQLPIFVLTQEHEIKDVHYSAMKDITDYFWKYADSTDFVAGRIERACLEYLESLVPPFFKQLFFYVKEYKYAWHTPGHMGGVAFLKSPIGVLFHQFYGENTFRSDLSVSVPELGSLMEHSCVVGEAEKFAAETFGADKTYFVTNGTSTANKMAVMSSVCKGEVVIVDRNCHKSLQHALTLANVIPIYFKPTRNAYGIIGGIPQDEFTEEIIKKKIQTCPLIKNKETMPKLAVVTNSTYDGLIYNVNNLKDILAESNTPVLHFDEAWFPYANFHSFYQGKYAMSDYHKEYHPTVFSTQSTHKLLAAFSQASMIHIKEGVQKIEHDLFNETFMMHTSTSPQYSIIASLDISTKMMSGQFGNRLVSESMAEAIQFRQEFLKIRKESIKRKSDWFFSIWQPDAFKKIPSLHEKHFIDLAENDPEIWKLKPKDNWHGFGKIDKDHIYLDPIKVTILTPGINHQGVFEDFGIPAPIVSKFLMNKGVVDEKTGFYSMLFLFSIGVNKSKAMTLLSDLSHFKDCFDNNMHVLEIFPDLKEPHEERYISMTLADLSAQMHQFLREKKASDVLMEAFDILPEQVMSPNDAYQYIVRGNTKEVLLDNLLGEVILTMVAPYPPGIPVVMPGERVTQESQIIIEYLKLLEAFDNAFPGFENEVHGAEVKLIEGKKRYAINCGLI